MSGSETSKRKIKPVGLALPGSGGCSASLTSSRAAESSRKGQVSARTGAGGVSARGQRLAGGQLNGAKSKLGGIPEVLAREGACSRRSGSAPPESCRSRGAIDNGMLGTGRPKSASGNLKKRLSLDKALSHRESKSLESNRGEEPRKKPARKQSLASKETCDAAIAAFFTEMRIESSAVELASFLSMVRELQQQPAYYEPPSAVDLSEVAAMEAERLNTIVR